jgi:hypothetical protein
MREFAVAGQFSNKSCAGNSTEKVSAAVKALATPANFDYSATAFFLQAMDSTQITLLTLLFEICRLQARSMRLNWHERQQHV